MENVFLRSPIRGVSARTTSELASHGQNRPNQSWAGASENRVRSRYTVCQESEKTRPMAYSRNDPVGPVEWEPFERAV